MKYPPEERFVFVSQMRRASSSVPTNIVEGNGRRTLPQKPRFVKIAEASLDELDYRLIPSKDLGYIAQKTYEELCLHVRRVKYLLSKFSVGATKVRM